jgi:hypothetical protein
MPVRGLAVPAPLSRSSTSTAPQSRRSAQDKVDDVLRRLKPGGSRASSDRSATATPSDAEPSRPVGTVGSGGTKSSAGDTSVVILTQPGAPPRQAEPSAAASTTDDRADDQDSRTGLPLWAATLIAVALGAAIICVPRLRHRRELLANQQH